MHSIRVTAEMTGRNKRKPVVEVFAAEGSTPRRERLPEKPTTKDLASAAKLLEVPTANLSAIIDRYVATPDDLPPGELPRRPTLVLTAAEFASLVATPAGLAVTYTLRPRDAGLDRRTFPCFADALETPTDFVEPVIEWRNAAVCAAVDMDWHKGSVPSPDALRNVVNLITPVPAYWWITKSGGLRLIYFAGGGVTAEECAAVAGLQVLLAFPRAGFELKTQTRRPPGEWHKCEQTFDCSYARRLAGEATSGEASEAWLEEHGYTPGQRYPHDKCPVNPYPAAESNSGKAIEVFDLYIKCYVCQRDGRCCGSRDPGYFPLAVLSGERVPSGLKRCVKSMTHWAQARHVLACELPPVSERVARAIYRALLRFASEPDDVRPERCFWDSTSIVRMRGYWATEDGQTLRLSSLSKILAQLPACQDATGKVIGAKVEELSQPIDLSRSGFPPLTTVWGLRLTEFQPTPDGKLFVVNQTDGLRSDAQAERRPRYVPADRRMAEEDAWALIEEAFPRVNRNVVKLVIAAKGCSEVHAGLPPMLFLYGPTGAGKTATPQLAAAICGDQVHRIPYERDTNRTFAAIRTAKSKGSFANFDEFLKGAKRAKLESVDAMNFVLDLDPYALTHMLYVGSVPLGDMPAFLWTDTTIPDEVMKAAQIGRRVHYAHLPETCRWEATLAASGMAGPGDLRLSRDTRFVEAANAILSAVRDEWFTLPSTDFAAVAKSLGFEKIADSSFANEKRDAVRRLFEMICDKTGGVTDVPATERNRLPSGDTWRYINLSADSEATTVYANCGNIDEMDLKAVLGLCGVARLERKQNDQRLSLRFAGLGEAAGKFNGGLRP